MGEKVALWTRCVRKSSDDCPGHEGERCGREILQPLGGDVVSVEVIPPRAGVMQARKRE